MVAVKERVPEVKGHWRFDVYEGDIEYDEQSQITNKLVETHEGDNLVVTTGKNLLLDRLFNLASAVQLTAMGVGTVATAAAAGDTQLNSGGGGSAFLKVYDSTPTRSGQVVTCITTFATGEANFQWQELGLFNGTTNGTSVMFNRIAPIGPFTKSASVSIVVTVTITQS